MCGVVRCTMVLCGRVVGALWCGVVRCLVLHGVVRCANVWCGEVCYGVMW